MQRFPWTTTSSSISTSYYYYSSGTLFQHVRTLLWQTLHADASAFHTAGRQLGLVIDRWWREEITAARAAYGARCPAVRKVRSILHATEK